MHEIIVLGQKSWTLMVTKPSTYFEFPTNSNQIFEFTAATNNDQILEFVIFLYSGR